MIRYIVLTSNSWHRVQIDYMSEFEIANGKGGTILIDRIDIDMMGANTRHRTTGQQFNQIAAISNYSSIPAKNRNCVKNLY